jgi:uncharacterized protein YjiK
MFQQAPQVESITAFHLSQPTRTIVLDSSLREISGLSSVPGDSTLLAAVQDESGVLYFLRIQDGSVSCSVPFKPKGDFEGIELLQKRGFAMKSNGDLYELDLTDCSKPVVQVYETGIPKERDVESLAIDPTGQNLLFLTKEDPTKSTKRALYTLPIGAELRKKSGVLLLFEIDPQEVKKHSTNKDTDWFSPSGLAVDPLSGNYWVVSSATKELAVFNPSGALIQLSGLDKTLFAQPEGITFDASGNLFISNEAKREQGALIQYFIRN